MISHKGVRSFTSDKKFNSFDFFSPGSIIMQCWSWLWSIC